VTIRIVVADDQAMVRKGLRMLLDDEPDMEVVGEAGDGAEAVAVVRRVKPDVALMDIRMPNVDGLEATRRLLADGSLPTRVLVLTTFGLDEYVYEALRVGASGFLIKDAPAEELIEGVRTVASGEAMLAPAVTRGVIEAFARLPKPRADLARKIDELTPRELDVLRLVARGLSNAEIARDLFLSETTVRTHMGHILMKLDVRDRVQAVVFAYEGGLVQAGTEGDSQGANGGS
jgi:DNA-binding NarL/FixJ family response regulator